MEEYGLGGLAASAEAVLAGLGPLAAGLARLAVEAGQVVTLEAMELLVAERGRELLLGVVQLGVDGQAEREVRLPRVTGADGVRGAGSLFPRDAVLSLPPCGYSWPLQRLAEMFCRSGSYAQAGEFVLAAAGVRIGGRQLEQIMVAAAADAERFCRDRDQAAVPQAGQQEGEGGLLPLVISADGKGVAMRPEAR